jgi:hypothetical protein
MTKEKSQGFYFKASPKEMEWIERRMAQSGIQNKSAFIRKMAIDGHIINLDSSLLSEIGKLLRITAGNVNQIAKRVNTGGVAYREDVAEVSEQLTAIRDDFGKVLTSLAAITDAKPGKRFIAPLKITDLPEDVSLGESLEV